MGTKYRLHNCTFALYNKSSKMRDVGLDSRVKGCYKIATVVTDNRHP